MVFISGLVLQLINIVYVCVGISICLYQRVCLIKVMNVLICAIGVYTLAWMAYASVVIFRKSGQLCKDSVLKQSGQFIFVYVIILYCTVGIMLCCACMFCCVVASNKKKERSYAATRQTDLASNMI